MIGDMVAAPHGDAVLSHSRSAGQPISAGRVVRQDVPAGCLGCEVNSAKATLT